MRYRRALYLCTNKDDAFDCNNNENNGYDIENYSIFNTTWHQDNSYKHCIQQQIKNNNNNNNNDKDSTTSITRGITESINSLHNVLSSNAIDDNNSQISLDSY